MFDLGAQLTISARGAYALEEASRNFAQLMGFNGLQHKIYGRLREIRSGGSWTSESFLDGLIEKETHHGISGDLGWAVKVSLSNMAL